jgi:hypothetical protein
MKLLQRYRASVQSMCIDGKNFLKLLWLVFAVHPIDYFSNFLA